MKPPLVDGAYLDIPPSEYGFHHHDSETRANMMASHRLGYRQRQETGKVFWTHPYLPDVCFPSRVQALRAAARAIAKAEGL